MSSFNATAFTIAGTAIAIFGVALYIWDTRKDKVSTAFNNYTASGTNTYSSVQSPTTNVVSTPVNQPGGSRRRKRKLHKRTKKRY